MNPTTQNAFAISEYHDTREIYSLIQALVEQAIRPIHRDEMEKYLKTFEKKYASSRPVIEQAKKFIPGGVQHNLAFNYPYPIVFDRAEGAYLYDKDGNRHIDFLQAGGPTVLGSNYPAVKEKILELISITGPSTGLFHEYELKIAQFICEHIPGVDMFRMLGSGTEACMAAIRVAHLATGKKNIIKMGGGYHGWSDSLVYALRVPGTGGFDAHGIPRASRKYTQEAYPNNIRAIGGGSVNENWMQGIANITGKTVETVNRPTMAGALGAASCAFVGSGHFDSFHQINQFIEVQNSYTPDPSLTNMYTKLFHSYQDIYKGLKKAYIKANLERFNQIKNESYEKQ